MVSEDLLDVLERTWRAVCREYEAGAELPDMQALFDGADLARPARASEIVIANMLMEVMECVGRFSPCYKMPGRAFGLITVRENVTNRLCRTLAPEAIQRWDRLLRPLADAIQRNVGLILATSIVDHLMDEPSQNEAPCVVGGCACNPPRLILVSRSLLTCQQVVCEACRRPYRLIGLAD